MSSSLSSQTFLFACLHVSSLMHSALTSAALLLLCLSSPSYFPFLLLYFPLPIPLFLYYSLLCQAFKTVPTKSRSHVFLECSRVEVNVFQILNQVKYSVTCLFFPPIPSRLFIVTILSLSLLIYLPLNPSLTVSSPFLSFSLDYFVSCSPFRNMRII